LVLLEKLFQLRIISEALRHLFFEREIARSVLQEFVLGTLQITLVVVGDSLLRTNGRENSGASGAALFLRALTLTVLLAVSSAGTETGILVVSSISSANGFQKVGALVASDEVFSLVFTFSEVLEVGLVALQFAQISVSHSVLSTSRHEGFRTELTSLENRGTLSIGLFNHSDAVQHALVVVGESIDSANWSVELRTVTSSHAGSLGGGNLLGTRKSAEIFESVSGERTDGGEGFSLAFADEGRVVGLVVFVVAGAGVGQGNFVEVQSALVEVSHGVSSADWEVGLGTVRSQDSGVVDHFGAGTGVFHFNISCRQGTLVWICNVVYSTYWFVSPRTSLGVNVCSKNSYEQGNCFHLQFLSIGFRWFI